MMQLSSYITGGTASMTTFKSLFWFLLLWMVNCTTPLNLEVEWCLQGETPQFTGFFTEVLGLSSGIREIFPKARLVKSVFDNSFDEPLLPDGSKIYDELFDKEKENIRYLTSRTHNPINMNNSTYLKFMNQPGKVDAYTECESPEEYFAANESASDMTYVDSSRSHVNISDSKFDMKTSCCHACAAEPLCLAWTLSAQSCKLQTRFEKVQAKVNFNADVDAYAPTKTFASALKSRKFQTPRAVIFHGTMCGYQNASIQGKRRDINTIYVGRYMFERGSMALRMNLLPEEYKVFMCMLLMDEVWVPTEWMKRELELYASMSRHSIPVVAVVPEAVDTTLFDPGDHVHAAVNNSGTFQFVSIFKWEDRKGWDVLLRAYWNAFSPTDDVILRLHTYRPGFLARQGQVNISDNLHRFAHSTFGKDLSELAAVTLGNKPLSDEEEVCEDATHNGGPVRSPYLNRVDMKELFKSSDAFVLPTRGEGWCLPAAEAMAMALPVIITNYSGPTGYANDENSYLIPILEASNDNGQVEPDIGVLMKLMKHVRDNSAEAKGKGWKARETMKGLSPKAVASTMATRLRELVAMRGWEE